MLSHALMRTSFPLYSSRSTTKPISQVVCIKPLDICVSRKYSIIQINDVTAAVLREEQLRKATTEALGARDAAEQLSQLKSSFVSTVSHELRTPLTSISGALTLLESGVVGEMSEKASSMVEMALRNTNRLMMLINDILDMEKIERGRMEFSLRSIDLHDVLKSAVADTQAYAERFNVHYRLSCDEGCWVNGDAGRLGQVMNNFLSNGAKFEPAGGEVKVLLRKIGGAVR